MIEILIYLYNVNELDTLSQSMFIARSINRSPNVYIDRASVVCIQELKVVVGVCIHYVAL